jgi:hypothetical protein
MDYNAFAQSIAEVVAYDEPEDCLLAGGQSPQCQSASQASAAVGAAVKRELSHVLRRRDVDLVLPGTTSLGGLALTEVQALEGGGAWPLHRCCCCCLCCSPAH